MWIMITKKIQVAEKHRPQPLDIYWSIPWFTEKPDISSILKKMNIESFNDLTRKVISDPEKRPYFTSTARGTHRRLINADILKNKEITERLWDVIDRFEFFPDNSPTGFTPNARGLLRVMVGDEAVGVFPHECSIITKGNMEEYLKESHTLVMSEVSRQVFGIFDEDQKFIKDAAMLDGCDEDQACRVAIGKPVEFDFPIPFGYYSCNEETRSHFF